MKNIVYTNDMHLQIKYEISKIKIKYILQHYICNNCISSILV